MRPMLRETVTDRAIHRDTETGEVIGFTVARAASFTDDDQDELHHTRCFPSLVS
jgi:hypothetical protein